ncbi:TIGR01777 family oxidoreductase [Nesterenkonia sp. F]|uniref:TIGR01777 family oxidoreductase n=1 Tax=Nesterenkonia sp. F TaxID=795955 RepID=UPI000255C93E|nr:TIGR01777 family oxidoreductase [Nesterenkonia sp. F]
MPSLEFTTHLPFRREDVFDWLTRPGALTRLHPAFAGAVVQEPPEGPVDGSESVLEITLPGVLGTGLAASAGLLKSQLGLPVSGRTRWTARHVDHRPGVGFSDIMVSGPLRSWRHDRVLSDDGAGTRLDETITYRLPGEHRLPRGVLGLVHRQIAQQMRRVVAHRERQALADMAFHHQHGRLASQLSDETSSTGESARTRVVAVSGATGMIGTQVCALLGGAGIDVRRLVRRSPEDVDRNAEGPGRIPWDPSSGRLPEDAFDDVDAVIHLAGHPLFGRFTAEHKRRIRTSRRDGTQLIVRGLSEAQRRTPRARALISGSAIGWYGASAADRPHDQEILTEDLPAGEDFLAEVCAEWEEAAGRAAEAEVRVATVRTGIVQSPAGGVLAQMPPLFVAGVGGRLGDDQVQSWISLDDVAALIVHLALSDQAAGPVNAVGPEPVTARRYAATLGAVLHRPAAVPVPTVGPRALLGAEGVRELALADQRVSSSTAESLGYAFRHRTLEEALRHVLGR